jgi:hypothetical protein
MVEAKSRDVVLDPPIVIDEPVLFSIVLTLIVDNDYSLTLGVVSLDLIHSSDFRI